jgi:hypothetical protein
MIKPLFPEDRSKLPGTMDMVLKRICRFPLQNGECLPIGKPGQARSISTKTLLVRWSSFGRKLQTPFDNRSGNIGNTRSGR